jgi:hypothetical protein
MKIQYQETSIAITCDGGFSTIQNDIRYSITANLVDADTLASVFPDKQFNLKDGKLNYSSSVVLADMWSIIDTVLIDTTDTGKTVKEAIIKWSINLIYQMNLLELDKSKWGVK